MKHELIPVILANNPRDFKNKLAVVKSLQPKPKWIQIDVVDGKFAPWKTWADPKIVNQELKMKNYEVDLMVIDPLKYAKTWIKAGAKRILFHVEKKGTYPVSRILYHNNAYIKNVVNHVKARGAEVGLSLNAATPVSVLYPYLVGLEFIPCRAGAYGPKVRRRTLSVPASHAQRGGCGQAPVLQNQLVDCVLFLGVNPGKSGQPFQSHVLKKIRALRREFSTLPIEVDGGVSLKNALTILRAGATRLAAASAIHKAPDPKKAYREFLKVIRDT